MTNSKGHKTPSWNEKFQIKVTSMKDDITFTVFEEDTLSNDLIGDASYRIDTFCKADQDKWVDIFYDKKKAGSVYIRTHYVPEKPIESPKKASEKMEVKEEIKEPDVSPNS